MADRALTDLELERWLVGDLPEDRTRAATAADQARLDELRRDQAAFLAGIDVGGEVRAIRARAAGRPSRRHPRRVWLVSGGALAAAAVAVVVLLRGRPEPEPDDVRTKGASVGLVVHVATADGSRPIMRDGGVRAGDRIRFEVSVPRPGYLAVIGIDPSGAATVYYPFGGAAPARIGADAGAVLPGAVQLDATDGDEAIYAVYGEQTFALGEALFAALRGGASVPALAVTRVLLHKTK
ncbi:MAG TPA: DUF4384 domain-containing protein [Kofleriaceae bacterium]|nr:DUF4384 domain-containing protein [Kofleriaceae bacterium]